MSSVRALWAAAIVFATLGTWLLFDASIGINWSLVSLLSALGLGLFLRLGGNGPAPAVAGLLAGVVLAGGVAAVTTSSVFHAGVALADLTLLSAALLLSTAPELPFLVRIPFVAARHSLVEGVRRCWALLAAGADEKIHVGRPSTRLGKPPLELRLLRRRRRRRAQDRVARRVVDGDPELEPASSRRQRLGRADGRGQPAGQPVPAPDHGEPHALLAQAGGLASKIGEEETHQAADLGSRPLPVVGGEGIERQGANSEAGRCLHHAANGGHPATVPLDPRESPRGGPATIAVHDDRHVEGGRAA